MLFNFQDADLNALVKTMSQITGRNFLLDPRTRGKVTIISSKPVPKASAYQIFIAALKAQGFTTVEGPGGIVKIIPEAEAKQGATVGGDKKPPKSDQWITQVIMVQYASASQLVQLMRPLLSPHALLSVYSPSNALIVTDTSSGIRNLMSVIEQIDRPGSTEVTVVPLQHVSANDLAALIARLEPQAGVSAPVVPGQPAVAQVQAQHGIQAESRLVIIPDARTNSLLVRSDNPGRVDQVRSLIAKLDVPARLGGNTRVVFLRNADAVKLAELLRGLLAGEARATTSTSGSSPVPGAPTAGLLAPGLGGAAGSSSSSAGAKAEPSLVQADQATNALIISASDAVYNNLRAVIEQLDGRRAQVFVEALIAEVTASKAAQLGIQWSGGGTSGSGGATVGAVNYPASGVGIIGALADSAAAVATLGSTAGLAVGFLSGTTITLPDGTQVRGLGALARALEEKSDANILSTPNLLTVDNVESKIVVGQNVPFLTGSYAGSAGVGTTVNPFTTIERKDVGLTLKIKPLITEGSGVRLTIYQEISSVAPGTGTGASDIITNKRSIDTTVIAEDGNIVVLGGLIQDEVTEGIQAVPFVSEIPILGELFKYRNRTKKKTNLMVFLRPVIVRSPEDIAGFTNDRYDYIRLHQEKLAMDRLSLLPRYKPPVMPPYSQPPRPAPAPKSGATPSGTDGMPAVPEAGAATAPDAAAASGPAAEAAATGEAPVAGERSGDIPPPPTMPAGQSPEGEAAGSATMGPPDTPAGQPSSDKP